MNMELITSAASDALVNVVLAIIALCIRERRPLKHCFMRNA